jgi:hypothetical protein
LNVQPLRSLHRVPAGFGSPTHWPAPSQWAFATQVLRSLHLVPAGFGAPTEQAPVAGSQVPANEQLPAGAQETPAQEFAAGAGWETTTNATASRGRMHHDPTVVLTRMMSISGRGE